MNRAANCPECGQILFPTNYGEVALDRCRDCGGLWFDDREIGQFREAITRLDPDKLTAPSGAIGASTQLRNLRCPSCAAALRLGEYAYGSGIHLARCAGCSGSWLPGSEIPRFLAHLEKARARQDEIREIAGDVAATTRARIARHSAINYSPTFSSPLVRWYILPEILPMQVDSQVEQPETPWVTISLIALFLLVQIFLPSSIVSSLALVPAEAFSLGGLKTFLTSGLVHNDWFHLTANVIFLWLFGDKVENRVGRTRFLLLYFLAEIAANLLYVLSVGLTSDIPCVGASGAISGVLGAFLVLFPTTRIHLWIWGGTFRTPAWAYLGGWWLLQLVAASFDAMTGFSSGVAWTAHLGGFALGFGLGLSWRKLELE